ncbi:hypothetical protein GOP47_0020574 [Adiantum capillus-veneris]|uniref:Uncharacterized protein n=1 Tax=Adiantum capillus-veneris TaxID=13818 RepID=A0A9D4U9D2_ADICA|nr:hypothetical protein GOP47_0020574 [Adiantum capillus-veneris]
MPTQVRFQQVANSLDGGREDNDDHLEVEVIQHSSLLECEQAPHTLPVNKLRHVCEKVAVDVAVANPHYD